MIEKLHPLYPSLYGMDYDQKALDARFSSLIEKHKGLFGATEPMVFSASGRTEIAGNHTDHNLGMVIGASINLDTIAAVSPRDDGKVVFVSEGYPTCTIDLSSLEIRKEERNTTSSLLRGIANAFRAKGFQPRGFNANLTATVLPGSGLSSSASVEVLIASIFNTLSADDALTSLELAKIGQYAENVYFGKPSGLLDQTCCAWGGIVGIDFKDKEKPVVSPVAFDFAKYGLSMVITDTKGSHADLTDEYAAVPPEMRAVAAFYGKENLREVSFQDFLRDIPKIREKLGNDRALLRAYHFFTENQRVEAMLEELKAGDIEGFLRNVTESGNSSFRFLQNVYPSSAPAFQGLSLAIAKSEAVLKGEGAVRVHGGGFAGTIQAYVPSGKLKEYIIAMEELFGKGCTTVIAIREKPVGRIL